METATKPPTAKTWDELEELCAEHFTLKMVDEGIGAYECHGHRGVHVDWQIAMDDEVPWLKVDVTDWADPDSDEIVYEGSKLEFVASERVGRYDNCEPGDLDAEAEVVKLEETDGRRVAVIDAEVRSV